MTDITSSTPTLAGAVGMSGVGALGVGAAARSLPPVMAPVNAAAPHDAAGQGTGLPVAVRPRVAAPVGRATGATCTTPSIDHTPGDLPPRDPPS